MKITSSIIDYIGKFEGGILTSVGLMYEGDFYDAIFFYTDDKMIITIDKLLKDKIGEIELHEDYIPLMQSIIDKVDPYEDIIEEMKEVDIK